MDVTELMVVPVSGSESVSLRSGRLPTGERVGIAFSTESRLRQDMGAGQRWILIGEPALKAMPAPLGIDRVQVDRAQVDPGLIAPGLIASPAVPAEAVSVPIAATSIATVARATSAAMPLTTAPLTCAPRAACPAALASSRELVKEFT